MWRSYNFVFYLTKKVIKELFSATYGKKKKRNKKPSENADTSTSVTFDPVEWPWPFVKVKKADVIRYRLLYCTLVPGMTSMGLILYEISPFVYFMWTLFCCAHRSVTSAVVVQAWQNKQQNSEQTRQKVRGSIPGSNPLCSCHCNGSNSHMQTLEVYFHCLQSRLSDETLNRGPESIA